MMFDVLLRGYSIRMALVCLTMVAMMGLLGLQAWNLQVRGGKEHVKAIRRQSVRRIRIPPIRGRIFSSDGTPFTDNQPSYDVYFHIHELRQGPRRETVLNVQEQVGIAEEAIGRPCLLTDSYYDINESVLRDRLVKLVRRKFRWMSEKGRLRKEADHLIRHGTNDELRKWLARYKIMRHIIMYPALPLKAFEGLSEDELARLQEQLPAIPGLEISTNYRRIYPMRDVGAHIVGRVGKRLIEDLSAEEQRQLRRMTYYYYPEKRGRTGLERVFDSELSGKVGFKTVIVDSIGYYHDEEERKDAVDGSDVILTIDSRAQTLAQRLLEGKRAALVCLDVRTGAIIALASSPSYDIDRWNELYSTWVKDENKPLLNRALLTGSAPGSIVKPLVACQVLEHGIAHYDTQYTCIGYYALGNRKIHCHHRSGHGDINVLRALEVSCNPYFIKMGLELGIDRLSEVYGAAGFGRQTGVELRSRYFKGKLPSRANMKEERNRNWITADTALVSIGQGFISLSPLQAAVYTAAIANGGTMYRPHLLRAVRNPEGKTVRYVRREITGELPVKPETLHLVRAGMYKVVHGPEASASVCRNAAVTIAGKTGTAQMGTPTNRWHNVWFISFAPFEDPQYAVVVFVEDGKSGGRTAAPIVRAFYDEYLGNKRVATR